MNKKERDNIISEIKEILNSIQKQANEHGDTVVKNTILNIHNKIIEVLTSATDDGLDKAHKQLKSIAQANFNIPHFDGQYPAIISYTRMLIAFTILTDANFGDTKQKIKIIEKNIDESNSYLANLQEHITKLKEQKIDEIVEHSEKIEQFYNDFFETLNEENQQTQFDTIKEIASVTNAIKAEIKILDEKHQKPFHGDNGILKDIQTKYDDISSKETTAQTQIKAINSVYNDIISKQIDETKEEKSYTKPSKKETLDSFFKEIKDLEAIINTQKSEYEKLNNKTKQLNSELIQAQTDYETREKEYADLAEKVKEVYQDMSKGSLIKQHRENSTYFRTQYKWAKYWQLGILCTIFGTYALWLIPHLPNIIQSFTEISHQVMFSVFIICSSYIPFKIITSLNENKMLAKKLAEEYNHKHSLIDSTMGFNDFYKDDKESQKELVGEMIKALKRNPSDEISQILNKNSKSPLEKVVDKICNTGEDLCDGVKNTVTNVNDIFKKSNKQPKTTPEVLENTGDSPKTQEETQ